MSRRPNPIPKWTAVPSPDWRPDGKRLDAGEAAVVAVYVDAWRQGEDQMAVSSADLAEATRLSQSAVERARTRLLARGLLKLIRKGGGRSNPAVVALGAFANPGAAPVIEEGKPGGPPGKAPEFTPGFTGSAPLLSTESDPLGAIVSALHRTPDGTQRPEESTRAD